MPSLRLKDFIWVSYLPFPNLWCTPWQADRQGPFVFCTGLKGDCNLFGAQNSPAINLSQLTFEPGPFCSIYSLSVHIQTIKYIRLCNTTIIQRLLAFYEDFKLRSYNHNISNYLFPSKTRTAVVRLTWRSSKVAEFNVNWKRKSQKIVDLCCSFETWDLFANW